MGKHQEKYFRHSNTDGPYVYQYVEEEPGAGGKNQVAELVEFLRNYLPHHPTLQSWRPEGDKVMRANVWFAEARKASGE